MRIAVDCLSNGRDLCWTCSLSHIVIKRWRESTSADNFLFPKQKRSNFFSFVSFRPINAARRCQRLHCCRSIDREQQQHTLFLCLFFFLSFRTHDRALHVPIVSMRNISISSRVSLGRSIFSWRYYILYTRKRSFTRLPLPQCPIMNRTVESFPYSSATRSSIPSRVRHDVNLDCCALVFSVFHLEIGGAIG